METLSPVKPSSDERTWGMLTHFSALLGFFLPFGSIIGPLIAWSIKKDDSSFVDENGKAAVNFNLTWTIAVAIFWVIWLSQFLGRLAYIIMNADDPEVIIPEQFPIRMILSAIALFIPIILIYLFKFFMMLIATIQSSSGNKFHYPLTYKFIK